MILLLVGCSQTSHENKEVKIEDVVINNPNNTYYIKTQDEKMYPSDDAILITAYNSYKCVNTSMKYDEESGKYICVIEFKKNIE